MDKHGKLELKELPPDSWQRAQHERTFRFTGPPSTPAELRPLEANVQAARVGKTVIENFSTGERRVVTKYGTSMQSTEVTREAFTPGVAEVKPQTAAQLASLAIETTAVDDRYAIYAPAA